MVPGPGPAGVVAKPAGQNLGVVGALNLHLVTGRDLGPVDASDPNFGALNNALAFLMTADVDGGGRDVITQLGSGVFRTRRG